MTTIHQLTSKAKRHIANADRFERERAKAAETAETKEEARDREQRAAGVALIQLHKACETAQESFAAAIRDRVGVSRSRAYELIALAGGIPNKITPKSAADKREQGAKRMQKSRDRLSVTDDVTDNGFEDDGANVIAGPWPETVQRPARNTGRLEGKLEADDPEELAGRALNVIRGAAEMISRLPNPTKLRHRVELAHAAMRTAEAWSKYAARLKGSAHDRLKRDA